VPGRRAQQEGGVARLKDEADGERAQPPPPMTSPFPQHPPTTFRRCAAASRQTRTNDLFLRWRTLRQREACAAMNRAKEHQTAPYPAPSISRTPRAERAAPCGMPAPQVSADPAAFCGMPDGQLPLRDLIATLDLSPCPPCPPCPLCSVLTSRPGPPSAPSAAFRNLIRPLQSPQPIRRAHPAANCGMLGRRLWTAASPSRPVASGDATSGTRLLAGRRVGYTVRWPAAVASQNVRRVRAQGQRAVSHRMYSGGGPG
jgi:hypothetical protein